MTEVVAWAASNGDRSENADYQYGKKRLRQIDRRIRFLTKRIDAAEMVDPESGANGAGPDACVLRRHGALRQRGRYGAGREHRRRRRNRSGSRLHQLGVAAGARADEVRAGRPGRPPRPGRLGGTGDPGGSVSAHCRWIPSASRRAPRRRRRTNPRVSVIWMSAEPAASALRRSPRDSATRYRLTDTVARYSPALSAK